MPITTEIVHEFHPTIDAGEVIRTDPAEGTPITDPDQVIIVYVSDGPLPSSLSRWTGVNAATSIAKAAATPASGESRTVYLVTFVDLDLPTERFRFNDSSLQITWGGFDWYGVGKYGSIEAATESIELIAQPLRLTLSGVDPEMVTVAMDPADRYAGSTVSLYVGLLHHHTYALIDDPELLWRGYASVMTIERSTGSAVIKLECEHRLRKMPAASRYTSEDQRAVYSTDRCFDFLYDIERYVSKWGARDVGYGGGVGWAGGGGGARGDRGGRNQQP